MLMIYVWLAVVCVSALIEAFTLQMAGIWFVVGGLVALIMAACGVALEWQIIACIAISLVLLLALRKLCMKFILRKTNEKTNVDALTGLEVKLRKDITEDEMGEVKIGDVVWSAIAASEGTKIEKGTLVTVLKVQGNKLIVKTVEQETEAKEQAATQEDVENKTNTEEEPEENEEQAVEPENADENPESKTAKKTVTRAKKTKKE